MNEWISPTTGKRGLTAVLAIGVRQQSAYQRRTLAEKLMQRTGIRAGGEGHARGRHMDDVGAASVVEHVRPLEKARERLAVCAVADEAKAGVRGNLAGDAAHVAAPTAERECHAAIVARVEQTGLADVASPMTSSAKPGARRISYALFPSSLGSIRTLAT
jgi:hypothetical protein